MRDQNGPSVCRAKPCNEFDLPCEQQIDIIASLPCYTAENVDNQRGRGVFDRSINALRLLNEAGYGRAGSAFRLDLGFNPGGASVAPAQEVLEREYKHHLREEFGIEFGRLLTITNMPIRRFSDYLLRIGQQQLYQNCSRTVQPEHCRARDVPIPDQCFLERVVVRL
jgi:radical SAM/Cys-rich protein